MQCLDGIKRTENIPLATDMGSRFKLGGVAVVVVVEKRKRGHEASRFV
jgi:hypothetical protein